MGNTWYPGNDDLQGDTALGDQNDDTNAWSLIFTDEFPNFDEFLFASNDCVDWLITSKSEVYTKPYSNQGS